MAGGGARPCTHAATHPRAHPHALPTQQLQALLGICSKTAAVGAYAANSLPSPVDASGDNLLECVAAKIAACEAGVPSAAADGATMSVSDLLSPDGGAAARSAYDATADGSGWHGGDGGARGGATPVPSGSPASPPTKVWNGFVYLALHYNAMRAAQVIVEVCQTPAELAIVRACMGQGNAIRVMSTDPNGSHVITRTLLRWFVPAPGGGCRVRVAARTHACTHAHACRPQEYKNWLCSFIAAEPVEISSSRYGGIVYEVRSHASAATLRCSPSYAAPALHPPLPPATHTRSAPSRLRAAP